ncbi:MAG TPA: DNA helicase [Saprospiraceae bacterium]|nr:DNA helicase [Saprospiraceae bacterium]
MIDQKIYNYFIKNISNVFFSKDLPSIKLEKIQFTFQTILDLAVQKERLHFTTLFAKLSYISQKFSFSPKLHYFANSFRINNRRLSSQADASVLEQNYLLGIAVCLHLLEALAGKNISDDLKEQLPYSFPPKKRRDTKIVSYFDNVRVVVIDNNPQKQELIALQEQNPEEKIRIRYNIPDRNENFKNTIILLDKVFGYPTNVQLLDVEMDTGGVFFPKGFVIEPDYLVDVSAVAASIGIKHNLPLAYMVNKFLPYEVSAPIMLGNIANFFLDELTTNPDQSFPTLFPKVFRQYPLIFSIWEDAMIRTVYQKSQKHFVSIHKVITQDFKNEKIDRKTAVLEPAFFSNIYGIQGRLDLFYESKSEPNKSVIIELKSGKPFRPNKYGLSQSHYTQTLLYDLLIRSISKKNNPTNYILYSALDVDQLKYAPRIKSIQYEAIQARNELVAIEKALVQINDIHLDKTSILEYITPKQFEQYRGFTFTNFQVFHEKYSELSRLEKRYFKAFTSFIARENWLAKVGDSSLTSRSGQAQLWMNSKAEKEADFSILQGLKMKDKEASTEFPVITFQKTETTNPLANFRVGDIVILHPDNKENASVIQARVIKGSIIFMDDKVVRVQLRSYQVNPEDLSNDSLWMLEPDLWERAFQSLYRSLFEWAVTSPERRNLLLTEQPPRKTKIMALPASPNLTDEQAAILTKMLSAKDYFLLWGPPGTGKTSVILKTAVQYLATKTKQTILLLAYTNRAVDEICAAIESDRPDIKALYFRIGNINSTNEHFRRQLLSEKIKSLQTRKEVKAKIQEHRIVVSTISSIINKPEIFEFMQFDTTLIDEASQILEPQLVGILSRVKRFILIGDHRQLPAVVAQKKIFSQKEDDLLAKVGIYDLANSFFERLFMRCRKNQWDWAYGMLSRQGRMHQDVMAFANKYFYDGKLRILPKGLNPRQSAPHYLQTQSSNNLQKRIAQNRLIFLDTPIDESIGSGKKNLHEAQKIVEILQHIKSIYQENNKELTRDSIGIITPYRAQIAQIRETIFQHDPDWLQYLTIDTVERYQGGARDIIIISVCINKPYQLHNLVALSDENIDRKLNVALTRARDQIIMIGNKSILEKDKRYGAFIADYS